MHQCLGFRSRIYLNSIFAKIKPQSVCTNHLTKPWTNSNSLQGTHELSVNHHSKTPTPATPLPILHTLRHFLLYNQLVEHESTPTTYPLSLVPPMTLKQAQLLPDSMCARRGMDMLTRKEKQR
jgi:hypothetical protein